MVEISDALICNMALGRIGVGARIEALSTDTTPEAVQCRSFYDISYASTLREFSWPFANKIVTMTLVQTSPDNEWGYSYRYPSDCLKIKRLMSGFRNDSRDTRVPFTIRSDDDGRLIFTDQVDAEIEYTFDFNDNARLPADFVSALAWRIAYEVAPSLGGPAGQKWRSDAAMGFAIEMTNARNNALDEVQVEEEPDSEFIRARE
jgi:hypothetical protein